MARTDDSIEVLIHYYVYVGLFILLRKYRGIIDFKEFLYKKHLDDVKKLK